MNPRRSSVRKKPTHAGEPPAKSAEPDRRLETFYHVAIGCFVAHLELKLGYELHKHGTVTGAAGVELLLRPHIFEQTEPDDRVRRFAHPEEWPVLELSVSGSRRDPLTVDDIYEDLHDDVLSVPTEDGGLTIAQVSVSVQKEATFAKVSVRFGDGASLLRIGLPPLLSLLSHPVLMLRTSSVVFCTTSAQTRLTALLDQTLLPEVHEKLHRGNTGVFSMLTQRVEVIGSRGHPLTVTRRLGNGVLTAVTVRVPKGGVCLVLGLQRVLAQCASWHESFDQVRRLVARYSLDARDTDARAAVGLDQAALRGLRLALSPQFIVNTAIGLDHLQGDSAAEDAFVAWYEKRYSSPHSLSKRERSALGDSYKSVFEFIKKWLEKSHHYPDNLRTPFVYPPAPEPPSRQEEADDHESPLSGRAHSSSDSSKRYPELKRMHGTTGGLYFQDRKTGETFEADRYGNPVFPHVPHARTW